MTNTPVSYLRIVARLLSVWLLIQYVVINVNAQDPTYYLSNSKSLGQYNIKEFSSLDGLPTNSLLGLCQSQSGYLWIASYDGLIRFDGQEFVVFNKLNTDEFESNTIRSLAEDSGGRLWMTSQGSGLLSIKNGKFTRVGKEEGIDHLYRALYIDDQDRVWAASTEKGWFSYQNGQFSFLQHEHSLQNIEVRDIHQTPEGIWFGTFGEGLYLLKDNKLQQFTRKDGLANDWIYSLFYDSKGTLWIGTSSGLSYFDGKELKSYKGFEDITINDILEDRYGNLWFASNHGLFRLRNKSNSIEKLNSQSGLPHNFINDFLIDREGNLWMAFYKGGLAQLKDGKFTNYTSDGGLSGKVVNAICELDSGVYLTAFDNGRLSLIKHGNIAPYYLKSTMAGERIRHILKDSKANLWISTYQGLLRIYPDGREKWYKKQTGFPHSKIRLSFEDSKGCIWVGTRNNGLVRINHDKSYTLFSVANGLSANLIMSIDEDAQGNILVGTSEGESCFNTIVGDKVAKQYTKEEGFATNVVFNSYTDKEGVVWVAALGGLVVINKGEIYMLSTKDGLACDSPFDVLEDNHGYIWMPCSKGIMRINKKAIFQYLNKENTKLDCRLFDNHDGMVESECNPTTQSLKTASGNLLIPTINGIAQINPDNIPTNNFKPPVLIKQITADKQKVDLFSKIVFDSDMKRLTFDYTAISLYEPEKVNFQYILDGFDDGWVDAGNSRSISYTNLDPGNYTFHVIASNNDNVWNTEGVSISFTILPKFTQRFIFYLILAVLFIGVVLLIIQLRIRQLKHKHETLERIIAERTYEIQEKNKALAEQNYEIETQAEFLAEQKKELNILNTSKDKMFAIIAHDLRGPLGNFRTMVDMMINAPNDFDPMEQKEMLQLLSQNANSTYELLENLLNWSSSQRGVITFEPKMVELANVTASVMSFLNPIAANKNISIYKHIENTIQVFADENMLRAILRNLCGNALKFTPEGGEVHVSAERKHGKIVVGVKDNGIGIKPESKELIFNQLEHTIRLGTNEEKGSGLGLLLCKEFVEKMEGEIWLESEPGNGSTFYFSLNSLPTRSE